MVNRDRGILTESDRDYLRLSEEEQQKEYSAPARSQRRSAIRDRIQNALLDMPLIVENLGEKDRENIFHSDDTSEIADTLPYLIAFAAQHHGVDEFDSIVEEGLKLFALSDDTEIKVNVEISIWGGGSDIADVQQRLEEKGVRAVSFDELEALAEAHAISDEKYRELHFEKTTKSDIDIHGIKENINKLNESMRALNELKEMAEMLPNELPESLEENEDKEGEDDNK